jgi:hypothetical protein
MQNTKRPKWLALPLWLALMQLKPTPHFATGPTGNELIMWHGAVICSQRGAQDAVELLQAESNLEVAS